MGEHGLVALDWHSGNRSVLVDHELSGAVVGLTLSTRPEDVYRSLLEATAFGTRVIVETFRGSGVPVEELVVAGGLAKNALLMQIYADVTRLPLSVIGSEQGPALGSAIHAAVAAGVYPDVPTAAKTMGKVRKDVFLPDEGRAQAYDQLFEQYVALHDHFGRATTTMRRLKAIRRAAVASRERERVMTIAADVAETISGLRREVCALHAELVRYRLVVWTAGNVSARVPGHDLLVIKPSGVSYDDLTPENMVVCDLSGRVVEGEHAPSSDTAAQAYVYREMPARRRGRAHPLDVRRGLGGPGRAGALRADDVCRRVRRRHPGRAVRDHRRRLDRPRHRRDAARQPVPCCPDAQPRRLHHRGDPAGRRRGRGDVRGRRPHGAHLAPAGALDPDRAGATSTRSTSATRTSTGRAQEGQR